MLSDALTYTLHPLGPPSSSTARSLLHLPSFSSFYSFTDLVFVGYTADGYKKGLCHETPTAKELAGDAASVRAFTLVLFIS